MADLSTVQGSSLVVDPSSALNLLLKTFGTGPERAAQAEQQRLVDIIAQPTEQKADPTARVVTDVASAFSGGVIPQLAPDTPGVSEKAKEEALLRLAALNPQAANGVKGVLQSGDKQAQAALGTEVEQGARLAALVSSKKTFNERRKALAEIGTTKALAGEDLTRIMSLRNMSEDQLDLELTRMKVQAADMKTVLAPTKESVTERTTAGVPIAEATQETDLFGRTTTTERKAPVQPEQFVEVLGDDGESTGLQQSTTSQKLEAIPGRGPQTELAKIEVDFRNGLLTEEQAKTQKAIFEATPPKFQSTVGKLLGDQALAIGIYGADSAQVKALAAAIESEQKGEPPKFNDIAGLRKEHTKASGDFIKQRDAVNKINAARPNAAGDLSLIFNYMKVLDPQSTVRESEFANAQNAAGVPVRIWNVWNRMKEGTFLSPPQRAQFKSEALQIFNAGLKSQELIDKTYTDLAKRHNINPQDVVINWKAGLTEAKTPASTEDVVKKIKIPKGG